MTTTGTDMDRRQAWDLARSLSVRTRCRVYDQPDGHDGWDNVTRDTTMGVQPPATPWAIYLTDGDDYWLCCLDFDAHGDPAQADRQAHAAMRILARHGIRTLLCASGPDGGRHVWAATLEGIPAPLMRAIATAMRTLLPTLDISNLTNPRTGAARTPGSPHRTQGASRILAGDTDTIDLPDSHLDQWAALAQDLTDQALAHAPDTTQATPAAAGEGPLDPAGHPWIPGRRTSLPAKARKLIDTPCQPGEDRSRRQWAILLACARAHWTLADMLHLTGRPGMERARGWRRPDGTLTPRPATGPRSATNMLAADWARAVNHARQNPSRNGDDPTWDQRCLDHTAMLRGVLAAMASRPGRWATKAGPADRRVLTALVLLSTQALDDTIQADVRRLALLTGLGRETCRTSLRRLAKDGWIDALGRDDDTSPNRWKINPQPGYPQPCSTSRPQVNTPLPQGAGTLERKTLTGRLTRWLALAAHDLTTGSTTRILQGNQTADQHIDDTPGQLDTLAQERDETARRQGKTGILARREQTIRDERIAWEWWKRELEWMKAPRPYHQERRTILLPDALHGRFPRIPRTPKGRLDWHATMTSIKDLRAKDADNHHRRHHDQTL